MTEKSLSEKLSLFVRSWLSGEKCAVCGERETGGEEVVCPRCREQLAKAEREYCTGCGRRVCDCLCARPCMTESGCGTFVKLFFYGRSDDSPRNSVIYRLKNRRDRQLCSFLAAKLAPKILALIDSRLILPDEALIVPVPRGRARAAEAGTDQADELARALSRKTGIPYRRVIVRVREGLPQKELDAAGRRENAKGTFAASPGLDLSGFTAIIVDDVVTTGSTVAECAAALREAGARDVICAALASDELKAV
ncbi:MAG: ComF family protein [Clostridia bacterium]|nr:ComF family protein [Clostridia bacterium]MBP5271098.1 ComF family protein [Clostridia bacterium]